MVKTDVCLAMTTTPCTSEEFMYIFPFGFTLVMSHWQSFIGHCVNRHIVASFFS